MKAQGLNKLNNLLEFVNLRNQELLTQLNTDYRSRDASPSKPKPPVNEMQQLQDRNKQLNDDLNFLQLSYKELKLGTDDLLTKNQYLKKHIKELLATLKHKDEELKKSREKARNGEVVEDSKSQDKSVVDYAIYMEKQFQHLEEKFKKYKRQIEKGGLDEIIHKRVEDHKKQYQTIIQDKEKLKQERDKLLQDVQQLNSTIVQLQAAAVQSENMQLQEIELKDKMIDKINNQLIKQFDSQNANEDVKRVNATLQAKLYESEKQLKELDAHYQQTHKTVQEQHGRLSVITKENTQLRQQLSTKDEEMSKMMVKKQKELLQVKQQEEHKLKHAQEVNAGESRRILEKMNQLQSKIEVLELQNTNLKQTSRIGIQGILNQLTLVREECNELSSDIVNEHAELGQQMVQVIEQITQQQQQQSAQAPKQSQSKQHNKGIHQCVDIVNQLLVDRGQYEELKTIIDDQLKTTNIMCLEYIAQVQSFAVEQICKIKQEGAQQTEMLINELNQQYDKIYQLEQEITNLKAGEEQLMASCAIEPEVAEQQLQLIEQLNQQLTQLEQNRIAQDNQIAECSKHQKESKVCIQLALMNVNDNKQALQESLRIKDTQQQVIDQLRDTIVVRETEIIEQSKLLAEQNQSSNSLQAQLIQQINQLRLDCDNGIRENQLKETQISKLSNQIVQLNEELQTKTSELTVQVEQMNKLKQQLEQQCNETKKQLSANQVKEQELISQIDQLNTSKSQQLRFREQQAEEQIKILKQQFAQDLQQQTEQYTIKANEAAQQISLVQQQLISTSTAYDKQVAQLTKQIQTLNEQLRIAEQEISSLKRTNQESELKTQQLKVQIEQLTLGKKQEIDEYQSLLLAQLEQSQQQLNEALTKLEEQNNKMHIQDDQILALKQQLNETEQQVQDGVQQITELRNNQTKQLEGHQAQYKNLQNTINETTTVNTLNQEQIDKLNITIKELNDQIKIKELSYLELQQQLTDVINKQQQDKLQYESHINTIKQESIQQQKDYEKLAKIWKQSTKCKQNRMQQQLRELLQKLSGIKANFLVDKSQIVMQLGQVKTYYSEQIKYTFENIYRLKHVKVEIEQLQLEKQELMQFVKSAQPLNRLQIQQVVNQLNNTYETMFIKQRDQINSQNQQIHELELESSKKDKEYAQLQQQLTQIHQDINHKDVIIKQNQERDHSYNQEINQLNSQTISLQGQLNQKTQQYEQLNEQYKQMQNLKADLQQSEQQCQHMQQSITELDSMVTALQDQKSQLQHQNRQLISGQELTVQEILTKLQRKEQEHQSELQLSEKLMNRLETKTEELELQKQNITKLNQQNIELDNQILDLNETIANLKHSLQSQQILFAEKEENIIICKNTIQQRNTQIEERDNKISQLNQESELRERDNIQKEYKIKYLQSKQLRTKQVLQRIQRDLRELPRENINQLIELRQFSTKSINKILEQSKGMLKKQKDHYSDLLYNCENELNEINMQYLQQQTKLKQIASNNDGEVQSDVVNQLKEEVKRYEDIIQDLHGKCAYLELSKKDLQEQLEQLKQNNSLNFSEMSSINKLELKELHESIDYAVIEPTIQSAHTKSSQQIFQSQFAQQLQQQRENSYTRVVDLQQEVDYLKHEIEQYKSDLTDYAFQESKYVDMVSKLKKELQTSESVSLKDNVRQLLQSILQALSTNASEIDTYLTILYKMLDATPQDKSKIQCYVQVITKRKVGLFGK